MICVTCFFIANTTCLAEDDPRRALRKQYKQDELKILKAIQKRVTVKFVDQPLEGVITQLAELGGFNVWLEEWALAEEGGDPQQATTISFQDTSIDEALYRLLTPLEMSWRIERGQMAVTTSIADEVHFIRSFPIRRLLEAGKAAGLRPSPRSFSGPNATGSGFFQVIDSKKGETPNAKKEALKDDKENEVLMDYWIIDAVMLHVRAEWMDEGRGSMHIVGDSLVVAHRYSVLRAIEQFLKVLETALTSKSKQRVFHVRRPSYPLDAHQEIAKRLSQRANFNYVDAPLQDVATELSTLLKANIVIDEKALSDEGIDPDEPIVLKANQMVVDAMLNRILQPLGLTYLIDGAQVVITTEIDAEERWTAAIIDVRDLVDRGIETVSLLTSEWHSESFESFIRGRTFSRPVVPGFLGVSTSDPNHLRMLELIETIGKNAGTRPKKTQPKYMLRRYQLTEYVKRVAQFKEVFKGRDPMDEAVVQIRKSIDPVTWHSPYTDIDYAGDVLLVWQTAEVHDKVAAFVDEMLVNRAIKTTDCPKNSK